jgi:hypothetical protein
MDNANWFRPTNLVDQVTGLAGRFKASYFKNGKWQPLRDNEPTEPIYDRLAALPPTASVAEVDAILGNGTWVGDATCTICRERAIEYVELGDISDYDSATITVCPSCARQLGMRLEDWAAGR